MLGHMRLGLRQFRKILSFTRLIVSDWYWPGALRKSAEEGGRNLR